MTTETLTRCPMCSSLYRPGVRILRAMEERTCHWVEHLPDGDYQCDMSPGHYIEASQSRARLGTEHPNVFAHRLSIRLTERLCGESYYHLLEGGLQRTCQLPPGHAGSHGAKASEV